MTVNLNATFGSLNCGLKFISSSYQNKAIQGFSGPCIILMYMIMNPSSHPPTNARGMSLISSPPSAHIKGGFITKTPFILVEVLLIKYSKGVLFYNKV